MRLDDVHIAIRPRTHIECLDLAIRLWGKHFTGLAIATAIGVCPMIWLQYYFSTPIEENSTLFYLIGFVGAPWVTMPIMIYLGQITFSQKFSLRQAARTALGVFPSFFLFEGLLRLICVSTVVLSPMVFIGMYYLGPILLLERPALGRVWGRRIALQSSNLRRILSFWRTDFMVMIAGPFILGSLLRGVSSLWTGRFDTRDFLTGGRDYHDSYLWENHVAFWLVMGFLAVFRFITYLDCRIRLEGWDVELKLRAEAAHFPNRESA